MVIYFASSFCSRSVHLNQNTMRKEFQEQHTFSSFLPSQIQLPHNLTREGKILVTFLPSFSYLPSYRLFLGFSSSDNQYSTRLVISSFYCRLSLIFFISFLIRLRTKTLTQYNTIQSIQIPWDSIENQRVCMFSFEFLERNHHIACTLEKAIELLV